MKQRYTILPKTGVASQGYQSKLSEKKVLKKMEIDACITLYVVFLQQTLKVALKNAP